MIQIQFKTINIEKRISKLVICVNEITLGKRLRISFWVTE